MKSTVGLIKVARSGPLSAGSKLLITLLVGSGCAQSSFAGFGYFGVKHQGSATASAVDGTGQQVLDANGVPVDTSSSFISSALSYVHGVGATIFQEPFFSSNIASIDAKLKGTGWTYSSHTDANANTGLINTDPYFGGQLTASASVFSDFSFTVDVANEYQFSAGTTHFGSIDLFQDGISMLDGNSPTYDQRVNFAPGHTYRFIISTGAFAQASSDFAFYARSNDGFASVTLVPEPATMGLVFGTIAMIAKGRRPKRVTG